MDWNNWKEITRDKIETGLRPRKVTVEHALAEGYIKWQSCNSPTGTRQDFSDAWAYFKKAMTLDPKCAPAYMMLGELCAFSLRQYLGRYWKDIPEYEDMDKRAMDYFDKSIEINPKEKMAWLLRGLWLLSLKHHTRYDDKEIDSEAMKDIDKALELDPEYTDALFMKGDFCGRLKKFKDAIICYEKIIATLDLSMKNRSNIIAAQCKLGIVLVSKDNPDRNLDEAAKCFKFVCTADSLHSTTADLGVLIGPYDDTGDASYGEFAEICLEHQEKEKNGDDRD